jgi:O-antigen ligase
MTPGSRVQDLSATGGEPYVVPLVLGGLVVWRWMLPPENVLLGGTLWIAQCSLLLPVLAGLLWRKNERKLAWGVLDSCLWIIVLGHWISFLWMLSIGGNLRTGFNLCWEWTALAATVFVMRQVVQQQIQRQELLRLLVAIGIAFAGIGLWQHYVSYRTVIEDYEQLVGKYDALIGKAETIGLSRIEQRELRQLSLEIQEMKIPVKGPARDVFERRLADSRQPVGRWALANSLGGVLAVTALLLLPPLFSSGRARWWSCLFLTPVALCLWQTRSRTAWVAALVGLFFYGLRELSPSDRFYRRFAVGSLIAGAVLGSLAVVWGMSGLDRIDFASNYALRSLQFRLQYWSGSLAMLLDSPIFGVGPGNFREHYLRYKLAASSEQIADPHNSFFDLWANGGLAALAAGLLITYIVLRRMVTLDRAATATTQHLPPEGLLSSPWTLGAEIALVGLFLFALLTTGQFDKELMAVAVALPFLDLVLQRFSPVDSRNVALIAAVALGVHLLGAGGTQMPGIVLFGAALLVVATTEETCCAVSRVKRAMMVAAGLLLAGGMWWTTTAPTETSRKARQAGWEALTVNSNLASAREFFRQAAAADPDDPEPWRLLAQLELTSWMQRSGTSQDFERAIEAWNESSQRDPWSSKDDLQRAEAYWARYRRTEERADARQAVSWYEQADKKMPHDERILSGLAFAAEAAGMKEKSRNAAESAIEIHELSRKNGHWEKLLPDEVLERLDSLLAP